MKCIVAYLPISILLEGACTVFAALSFNKPEEPEYIHTSDDKKVVDKSNDSGPRRKGQRQQSPQKSPP